jgi:hypothetical protein
MSSSSLSMLRAARRGFHRRLRKTVAALEDVDRSGVTRLYQFFRYSVVEFCCPRCS